jgi:competence protein ComEA
MLQRFGTFLGGLLAGLLATGLLLLLTRSFPRHAIELIPPPTAGPIQVHVTGAVIQPGVFELAPDSIVEQALVAAGGPTDQADLSRINLAETLRSGQQIYIPSFEEPQSSELAAASPADTNREKININTGSAALLESLPGIGPSLATNIVEHREQHGWFQEPDELLKVSGIGPAKLEQIRDLITFH